MLTSCAIEILKQWTPWICIRDQSIKRMSRDLGVSLKLAHLQPGEDQHETALDECLLKTRNHRFPDTDPNVVVHLYKRWGWRLHEQVFLSSISKHFCWRLCWGYSWDMRVLSIAETCAVEALQKDVFNAADELQEHPVRQDLTLFSLLAFVKISCKAFKDLSCYRISVDASARVCGCSIELFLMIG